MAGGVSDKGVPLTRRVKNPPVKLTEPKFYRCENRIKLIKQEWVNFAMDADRLLTQDEEKLLVQAISEFKCGETVTLDDFERK